ncbi:MAG: hypothetical protein ACOC9W_04075, partial [Persicimonas sp.]
MRQMLVRPHAGRVHLGRPTSSRTHTVVVQIAMGEGSYRPGAAEARLVDGQSLEQVRDVVRFCARRRLPVGGWLITGAWQVPTRVDRLARWVSVLAEEAGEATVWIDDTGMPGRFRRRLQGHLR